MNKQQMYEIFTRDVIIEKLKEEIEDYKSLLGEILGDIEYIEAYLEEAERRIKECIEEKK